MSGEEMVYAKETLDYGVPFVSKLNASYDLLFNTHYFLNNL